MRISDWRSDVCSSDLTALKDEPDVLTVSLPEDREEMPAVLRHGVECRGEVRRIDLQPARISVLLALVGDRESVRRDLGRSEERGGGYESGGTGRSGGVRVQNKKKQNITISIEI